MFEFLVKHLPGRVGAVRIRIALALALVVGASFLFWASRDYAVIAPNWDGFVRGISYTPSHNLHRKRPRVDVAREDRQRHGADLADHGACAHLHGLERS